MKIGSGLLADLQGGVNLGVIKQLTDQVVCLVKMKYQVILVSSGAISAGMSVLKYAKRPVLRESLQACASIGQPILMRAYQEALQKDGMCAAQILVTSWDLDSRTLYKNTQTTLEHLMGLGHCVPIFNENDALSFEEIEMLNKFGDNDTLSAHVALLAKADRLILLTSVDGFRTKPSGGKLISRVERIDDTIMGYAQQTNSERSVGGMVTKLNTARVMLQNAIPMHIADGLQKDVLLKIVNGEKIGTIFEVQK